MRQSRFHLDRAEREARRERILNLYLRCYTAEEIGEAVGIGKDTAENEIESLCGKNADLRKFGKVTFSEPDWSPPIYNVWAFGNRVVADAGPLLRVLALCLSFNALVPTITRRATSRRPARCVALVKRLAFGLKDRQRLATVAA